MCTAGSLGPSELTDSGRGGVPRGTHVVVTVEAAVSRGGSGLRGCPCGARRAGGVISDSTLSLHPSNLENSWACDARHPQSDWQLSWKKIKNIFGSLISHFSP